MKNILLSAAFVLYCFVTSAQNFDLITTAQRLSNGRKIEDIATSKTYLNSDNKWVKTACYVADGVDYQFGLVKNESHMFQPETKISGIPQEKLKYKSVKNVARYHPSLYSYEPTDLYKPGLAAFFAVVPGMGHIYLNEPIIGLAYLGGTGLALLAAHYAAWQISRDAAGFGAISMLLIYVANFASAVKIAKVKNLAIRDINTSLRIIPKVEVNHMFTCDNISLNIQLAL